MNRDQRLAGQVALVTGGASGIGKACAERLAASGARVVLTDLSVERGEAVVAAIRADGGAARFQRHDVTREADWQAVFDGIAAHERALHVLVNNAGIAWAGSILDMTLADWQHQNAVNLDGVFLGVRFAIPLIRDSGGGSIVNISSVAGLRGSAALAGYCATKGGVRLFTKAVAKECAQRGWNIRVNSVHPGVIDTPIWQTVRPADLGAEGNAIDPAVLAAQSVPGGRLGKPEDIANGVLFLASAESGYMNGAELVIDHASSA